MRVILRRPPRSAPRRGQLAAALAVIFSLALASPASARDQIRIVGSSTVFPFSTAVAERFGRRTEFKTPVVESTGSGGGLKLFCAGLGVGTPDITNASRKIASSELETCHRNGVRDVVEVAIGFDGIVIANAKSSPRTDLRLEQVFRALALQVPLDGALRANPYRTWSEVDASLPPRRIEVLGPPPTSGTRDAFVELAMERGALRIPFLAKRKAEDKRAFKRVAHALREDGAYIEAGENDNLIVRKLEANPSAFGIFGYAYLEQNADRIQASRIDGIEPTFERIASGEYSLSRSLYFYVKKQHVDAIPGIREYIAEFISESAGGPEGYLADKGLIPLPAADRATRRATVARLEPMRSPEDQAAR